MTPIIAQSLSDAALLKRYEGAGNYTDCLTIDVPFAVTVADYVEAFYTSRGFRPERMILALLLDMGSTDAQARALGTGEADRFAAWTVEARAVDQLLLCDYQRLTRSWLMVEPLGRGGTRLYFGTAVVPSTRWLARAAFHALLGFHRLYARVLLRSAAARLARCRR